ncbi:DUF2303 family protein [Thalassospira marina]|uniref:DUF2303 domain-containing protein n=1 Tax=Thalassospira marina TaxID=2048283 RepID=A0A2N3KUN6_9PROT|nr:DUF2303 family protein [Thalassospira marina]PKR54255.1 hypothetical protein COO20_08895 [Thalassospira marina]
MDQKQTMPAAPRSDLDALHDLVRKYGEHEIVDVDDHCVHAQAITLPDGRKMQSLKPLFDEFRDFPERREGTASMHDIDSFIDITNRFKNPEYSAVFAFNDATDTGILKLISVFDYHDPQTTHMGHARFMAHKAVYNFPLSDEWKAWHAKHDEFIPQADFAEFLEDHIIEVAAKPDLAQKPDLTDFEQYLLNLTGTLGSNPCGPSTLMELSRGLTIRTEERLETSQRLATGETALTFSTEHKDAAGGQLKVPDLFLINIPVWKGGPTYLIPVRLRFKKQGPGVLWKFMLHRSDLVLGHAFRETSEKVQAQTELPLFYGIHE